MTTRKRVIFVVVVAFFQAMIVACAGILLFPLVGWGGIGGGVAVCCATIAGMITSQIMQARSERAKVEPLP